jgi:hypothetical protein
MTQSSPEKIILTRLFGAQRRLRYVRGLAEALRWFAVGAALATLGLVVLWNWDRLPGPWQWLASAGRPREFLWLPPLLALGGFASRWLVLPPVRETAYKVDGLRRSQERLLTAVDWILSEKPRTAVSERLLGQAARDLQDEERLGRELRQLEKLPRRSYALLLFFLLPLALLLLLPAQVGLPAPAAVWLGPGQVDRLTEELMEELEQTDGPQKPEEKLEELLEKLNRDGFKGDEKLLQQAQHELQRTVDELKQLAKSQESARQLLETLAQRARQGQGLGKEDEKALEELKQMMAQPEQQKALEQAESDWSQGKNEEAAQGLEAMQQQAGESAQQLQEQAGEGQQELERQNQAQEGGQEFNEARGDQHPGNGQDGQRSTRGKGEQAGQGTEPGQGDGQAGRGEQEAPGDYGKGHTEKEEQGSGASGKRSLRQSNRTSDRTEEFQHLNPPIRNEIETSQTRVHGDKGQDGPRYRTPKEGLGAVTEPARLEGGNGLLEYRESAENALLREEIPADYRDQVRHYFEALDK